MQLKKAISVSEEQLEQFLKESNGIEISSNLYRGYVIVDQNKIISWFELEQLHNMECWLKQLFILRDEALQLPYIFEYILQFIKSQNTKAVYVHSNQLVTDLLLESLSFSVQEEKLFAAMLEKEYGTWWTYRVS